MTKEKKADNHVELQKLIDSKEWQFDNPGTLISKAMEYLMSDEIGMTEGEAYEYLELQ